MKRKMIWLLAIAAASVLMLTACTSSDKTKENGNSASSGEVVTQPAGNDTANQNTAENIVSEDTSSGTQDEIYAPAQGEPGYDGEPNGDIIPDEDAEAAENENGQADIWSGSYEDTDESVSVQLQDDGNISFAFAQSGIYGTAEVNGTQAVFHGDDYHVVVFNISGDTLEISVASEEDFDASSSPLNGTYTRK